MIEMFKLPSAEGEGGGGGGSTVLSLTLCHFSHAKRHPSLPPLTSLTCHAAHSVSPPICDGIPEIAQRNVDKLLQVLSCE